MAGFTYSTLTTAIGNYTEVGTSVVRFLGLGTLVQVQNLENRETLGSWAEPSKENREIWKHMDTRFNDFKYGLQFWF